MSGKAAQKGSGAGDCPLTILPAAGLLVIEDCPQAGTSAWPLAGHFHALPGWHLLGGAYCIVWPVDSIVLFPLPSVLCCKVDPLAMVCGVPRWWTISPQMEREKPEIT